MTGDPASLDVPPLGTEVDGLPVPIHSGQWTLWGHPGTVARPTTLVRSSFLSTRDRLVPRRTLRLPVFPFHGYSTFSLSWVSRVLLLNPHTSRATQPPSRSATRRTSRPCTPQFLGLQGPGSVEVEVRIHRRRGPRNPSSSSSGSGGTGKQSFVHNNYCCPDCGWFGTRPGSRLRPPLAQKRTTRRKRTGTRTLAPLPSSRVGLGTGEGTSGEGLGQGSSRRGAGPVTREDGVAVEGRRSLRRRDRATGGRHTLGVTVGPDARAGDVGPEGVRPTGSRRVRRDLTRPTAPPPEGCENGTRGRNGPKGRDGEGRGRNRRGIGLIREGGWGTGGYGSREPP